MPPVPGPTPHQTQGRWRPRSHGAQGHSRTCCIHCLLHDDLHPLHVVPVPEAIQSLVVLVSERQDLSHDLPGKETGCSAGSSQNKEILTPNKGPKPLYCLLREDALEQESLDFRASQPGRDAKPF